MRVFAVSFLLLLYTSSLQAATCGGSVPCACGDTVSANYIMTADLGPCNNHGLILSNGVTVDANGHRITGPGNNSEVYGVYFYNTTGATFKNGVITGFLRGVRFRSASGNTLLNTETHHNGNFSTGVGYGIDMANGAANNYLQNNSIHDNADEGIHFGSGSSGNTFSGNVVYNNNIENIYILSSNSNTFIDNTTWGGGNSVYLKDSGFNVFIRNTFRDATVLVRADAHDNIFTDNTFLNTGIHFQVYTKETPLRHPRNNIVQGGTISGAGRCVRFSSSWNNVVVDTILTNCGTDIFSDGSNAQARNSFIGVSFNPAKVQLDGNSLIDVGWHLNVHVRDGSGQSLSGARIQTRDVGNLLLFDLLTNSAGNIQTQEVLAYTRAGSTTTSYTPISLDTTKTGYPSDAREISFSGNTSVTVTLQDSSTPTNTPPIANAGGDQTGTVNAPFTFNASDSSDPDGDPLSYTWNFGDGSPFGSGATVSHAYTAAGTYIATLTVSDGEFSDSDSAQVTVNAPPPSNAPPTAHAGPDQTALVGTSVSFDGSGSTDPNDDPLIYTWNFGDGSPPADGKITTHTYATVGTYIATLTVNDGELSNSDSAQVTVESAGSFLDTFDRPDSSLLGNGWEEIEGDFLLVGGAALSLLSEYSSTTVLPMLSGPTQNVATDFISQGNFTAPRFGIILRFQNALNYYVLYRQVGGQRFLRISKIRNGIETILASTPAANPPTGTTFRLTAQAEGNQLTLHLNGVNEVATLSVSDTTFSQGTVGILLGSRGTLAHSADNFSATVK